MFKRSLSLAAFTALSLAPAWAMQGMGGGHVASKAGTYTGQARIIGNGVVYSWIKIDAAGKPAAIGASFTKSALEGLPKSLPNGKVYTEYALTLPQQAMKTLFTHVVINWNPAGHPPPGIYTTPHFDAHFYMMSSADRMKITAKGADLDRCQKKVSALYMPSGYVYAPAAEEAMMGAHWVDTASPEFHGHPFTKTFIYGSYNGKVTFFEPMFTRAYLQTEPNVTEKIKLPNAYPASGYYPTRYSIRYDPNREEYSVSLEGMVWRKASKGGTTRPMPRKAPVRGVNRVKEARVSHR